ACGLKMTFTLSSKLFSHKESARVMGLLTMAFAITPGLGVYLGGILVTRFNWTGPFYLMVIYGIAIFVLANKLPEMYTSRDYLALKLENIIKNYILQLKNTKVIFGGLLVGLGSSVVYVFAAISPFIAINKMHLTPSTFGTYNFIPCIGILIGSIASNYYGKIWQPQKSLKFGLFISFLGVIILAMMLYFKPDMAISLFLPMLVVYLGLSFVFGNAAALALHTSKDKGNASAMMSFINMGSAFVMVSITGWFNISNLVDLPIVYALLIGAGFIWYNVVCKAKSK
ncbi:MAG TPA: MFS transporter, partial [Aquella sp.]|nr:MFS transporter [Aquella sp.]